MVEILLNSIRPDRESNFELQMQTTRHASLFYSVNHMKYIRCVTLSLQDIMKLPMEIVNDFRKGMFLGKRKSSVHGL